MTDNPEEKIRKAGEVARLLGVCVQTVGRWARLGELPHTMTEGGHRRFREADVLALRDRNEDA